MQTIKKRGFSPKKPGEPKIKGLVDRATAAVQAHRKKVIPAAVGAVVLGLAVAAYAFIQAERDAKASALLATAYEYYSPASGVPADYGKALELFRDIRKTYASTTSGAIAGYYQANCLANLGRTDEALKEYRHLVETYSTKKFIAGLAYQRMGYLVAGQGNQAEAIEAFEQAERLLGPGLATVELARLYEKTGNVAESQKKYRIISEKLAGTQWAFEAMTKLPPPPAPPSGLKPAGNGK